MASRIGGGSIIISVQGTFHFQKKLLAGLDHTSHHIARMNLDVTGNDLVRSMWTKETALSKLSSSL